MGMTSVFALEELIAQSQRHVSNSQKQLKDAEDGNYILSPVKLASVENRLEESTADLEKYQKIYNEIPQEEKEKQRKMLKVQQALAKETYYKLQKMRIKKSHHIARNQKLEAMMIIDELPDDSHYDDKELISLSEIIIKNNIRDIIDIDERLEQIDKEFNQKLDRLEDNKDLKTFTFLDTYIPIVVLHFSIFVESIKDDIKKHNLELKKSKANLEKKDLILKSKKSEPEIKELIFKGLPNYEDWWIEELFKNHQAYFGLYKWKTIIENQCITKHQKIIWDKLFSNWLMIKKILNNKDENAFDYNFIFDELVKKYAYLEEEMDIDNLKSMEKIVYNITAHEDFTKTKLYHEIDTVYFKWKNKKLTSK